MINCPTCHTQLGGPTSVCTNCGQSFCPTCLELVADDAAFCPHCEDELTVSCGNCERLMSRSATFCPECGLMLREARAIMVPEFTRIRDPLGADEAETFNGICPSCASELYIEDGFCIACGQSLCTACGQAISDGDTLCPACGICLFFSCPLCNFELTAGTDMCPNCDALFASICGRCGGTLEASDSSCQTCGRPVTIQRRHSARTVRTFLVKQQLVRMVSCPGCGRHLNPAAGPCDNCGTRLCSECQLILLTEERACPRCGRPAAQVAL